MIFKFKDFKKICPEVYEDILHEIELTNDPVFWYEKYGVVEATISNTEKEINYTYGLSESGVNMLGLDNIYCYTNQPVWSSDLIEEVPELYNILKKEGI